MTLATTPFQPTPDGWVHIAPKGTFPHPNGTMQVLDAEAFAAMRRTFAEEAKGPNFAGLLVDFDHFSHDPAQPTTAAGWIEALDEREDGLHAKIRWSDLGQEALTGGRYRMASPVWNRADCDSWTAPAGLEGKETEFLRPRRLDRLALTNDPNLPGMRPLTNRKEKGERKKEKVPRGNFEGETREPVLNLRREVLLALALPPAASDAEIAEGLRGQGAELAELRKRCAALAEAQAEHDLERFGDVIVNREVVRAQLVTNREGTLALLEALRAPPAREAWHQPRLRRPNLQLLSPVGAEADPASARRVANRARQLQSALRIGHHAAFRMAEGEALDPEAA